jgi:hypothetical protein
MAVEGLKSTSVYASCSIPVGGEGSAGNVGNKRRRGDELLDIEDPEATSDLEAASLGVDICPDCMRASRRALSFIAR